MQLLLLALAAVVHCSFEFYAPELWCPGKESCKGLCRCDQSSTEQYSTPDCEDALDCARICYCKHELCRTVPDTPGREPVILDEGDEEEE